MRIIRVFFIQCPLVRSLQHKEETVLTGSLVFMLYIRIITAFDSEVRADRVLMICM
jgi:hypothetical protein